MLALDAKHNCQMLIPIRVAQVSFDRKVFAEAVQLDCLHVRSVTHAVETDPGGERYRTHAGEDFGRVVKKYLVDNTRGQCGPIDHGPAFDQQTGDLHGSEPVCNSSHIGTAVSYAHLDLL